VAGLYPVIARAGMVTSGVGSLASRPLRHCLRTSGAEVAPLLGRFIVLFGGQDGADQAGDGLAVLGAFGTDTTTVPSW
jgi:hypothetical protein